MGKIRLGRGNIAVEWQEIQIGKEMRGKKLGNGSRKKMILA